jgi:hypothetical protein
MLIWVALLWAGLQSSAPAPCTWGRAKEIGTLDRVVNESSGMAISRRIRDRTYRINDSGDTGRFFVMDLSGNDTKTVNITGFNPLDVEDMALGPCDASTDCLFIADIGDNNRRRPTTELVIVEEREDFPSNVRAIHRVRMQYPDGPHDAESIGVHPDGTVYILTKDTTRSQIFRLKREQWSNSGRIETLEPVVTLDWLALRPNTLPFTRQATAMDIAADGKRFIVLNYTDAVEFFIDLSAGTLDAASWTLGVHYRTIEITTLEQEEAIAYLPDGRGFLYDTERGSDTRPARIMRVDCAN